MAAPAVLSRHSGASPSGATFGRPKDKFRDEPGTDEYRPAIVGGDGRLAFPGFPCAHGFRARPCGVPRNDGVCA